MRHRRGVTALDVQHIILNPPDVSGTKKNRTCQRQGKATAARAARQALQPVHEHRPASCDGLSLHATILPVPVWPGDPLTFKRQTGLISRSGDRRIRCLASRASA